MVEKDKNIKCCLKNSGGIEAVTRPFTSLARALPIIIIKIIIIIIFFNKKQSNLLSITTPKSYNTLISKNEFQYL